jgi:hypothetical protein
LLLSNREDSGMETEHDEATSRRRRRAAFIVERELPGLVVRSAVHPTDRVRAHRLVHDVYVECGYIDAEPLGVRRRVWEQLPTTRTLVAELDGTVVGTASLVVDGPLGLPMEAAFGAEVHERRCARRRLAEVTGLAVAPAFRNFGVLVPLIRGLLRTALEGAVYEIVCAVSPKTTSLYTDVFLFTPLTSDVRSYASDKHDPVAALRCDLVGIEARIAHAYGGFDAPLRRLFPVLPAARVEAA